MNCLCCLNIGLLNFKFLKL